GGATASRGPGSFAGPAGRASGQPGGQVRRVPHAARRRGGTGPDPEPPGRAGGEVVAARTGRGPGYYPERLRGHAGRGADGQVPVARSEARRAADGAPDANGGRPRGGGVPVLPARQAKARWAEGTRLIRRRTNLSRPLV